MDQVGKAKVCSMDHSHQPSKSIREWWFWWMRRIQRCVHHTNNGTPNIWRKAQKTKKPYRRINIIWKVTILHFGLVH